MTAIVQLARYGDIASILPAAEYLAQQQGEPVDFVVGNEFADILQAAPYTLPHVFHGDPADVADAIRYAQSILPDRKIIATQVNGNPKANTQKNFVHDQWARAGLLDLYDKLPLNLAVSETAVKSMASRTGRRVGVNLFGHSSVLSATEHRICREHVYGIARDLNLELVDFSLLKLPNPADLVAIIRTCDLLITIDTLTLHLSYATQTPTIVLQRGIEWYQSPRRKHWIGRHDYEDLGHLETWAKIKTEIIGGLHLLRDRDMESQRIVNVLDWFPGSDPEMCRRHAFARSTRHDHSGGASFKELRAYSRTSDQTIGDTRKLPYLKDIIDAGAAAQPDIIVFCNADTCFTPETIPAVRNALRLYPAVCCGRYDITGKVDDPMSLGVAKSRGAEYPGADLFAFTVDFWRRYRSTIPDLLIACEGWDFVLWKTIEKYGGRRVAPLVYHEYHEAFWADGMNLKANPGQKHNRELCYSWAMGNGFADYLSDGPMLFTAAPQPLKMDVGTIVWSTGSFATTLTERFKTHPPQRILETGTHLGTGTTSIILRAMAEHTPAAEFVSIEVNTEYWTDAKAFLRGKLVKLWHGLSVPAAKLPTIADIQRDTIDELPTGVKVDFHANERVARYSREVLRTDELPDDLIGRAINRWGGAVDFVLLDSAGHMGWVEFQHLLECVRGPFTLMLDDTLHVKHYRTAKYLRGAKDWRVLAEGRERNGFMLAERIG